MGILRMRLELSSCWLGDARVPEELDLREDLAGPDGDTSLEERVGDLHRQGTREEPKQTDLR